MSQHTPAPWVYNQKQQRVTAEDGEQLVADIRGWGRLQYKADGEKIQDANGYLIAAAPELLDALEDMAAQHLCGCNHPACKNCERDAVCRSVIAKAKGDQS